VWRGVLGGEKPILLEATRICCKEGTTISLFKIIRIVDAIYITDFFTYTKSNWRKNIQSSISQTGVE
jgi:hypothetical protein